MLVLSRRPNQEIRFPQLGITLRVLKVDGKLVKVGVDAPQQVKVFRGEICNDSQSFSDAPSPLPVSLHQVRNRMNAIMLAVALLQKQLQAMANSDAEQTLEKLVSELYDLEQTLQLGETEPLATENIGMRRVLVVEDDDNERELLAGVLRLSGCHVDTAADGYEALEYLSKNETPDFVLLDMSMPRCGGAETIAMIRRDDTYSQLPVFAVSGQSAVETGVLIGPNGVDDWFKKPLNPNRLIDRICGSATTC